jgi:uncharacterized protein (DUF4415 family)
MPKRKPKHIKQRDWDTVESPPLTDAQLRHLKPAQDVVPAIVEAYRRTRGPQTAPKKVLTTIRLDAWVIEHFKSRGRGWQTRINEALKRIIAR